MTEKKGQKLITCILPKGAGTPALIALREKLGLLTASVKSARGAGRITPAAYRKLGAQSEKEVLTVVVPEDRADQAFEFIYHEAHIDQPHGGIVFMTRLERATEFTLPDLPGEG